MNTQALEKTATALVVSDKGLLAIEGHPGDKRFESRKIRS